MEETQIDYNKVVGILESMDQTKEIKQVVVNPASAFADTIETNKYDYDKAVEIINRTEGGLNIGYRRSETQQQTAKPQQKVQQKAQQFQPGQVAKIAPQKPVARREVNQEVVDTAREIKQIIGNAGKDFESGISQEISKVNKEKLVLPTLSLQDQIHELEGISSGLSTKAFGADQLKVINYEINGLSEKVKYEKNVSGDAFQKSLTELRNKRLDEIKKQLEMVNK